MDYIEDIKQIKEHTFIFLKMLCLLNKEYWSLDMTVMTTWSNISGVIYARGRWNVPRTWTLDEF